MITTTIKNLLLSRNTSVNKAYFLEIYLSDKKALRTVVACIKNIDSTAIPSQKESMIPGCYLLYKLSIPSYEKDFIYSLASLNGVSSVCLKNCKK